MWARSVLVRIFFMSSRRRHTRFALVAGVQTCALAISITIRVQLRRALFRVKWFVLATQELLNQLLFAQILRDFVVALGMEKLLYGTRIKIGRASCRDRVSPYGSISVVAY